MSPKTSADKEDETPLRYTSRARGTYAYTVPPAPVLPAIVPINMSAPTRYTELDNYSADTYSKQLAALAKMYGPEHKYNGINDNFDYKFKIFVNFCQKAGLPREGLSSAFDLMLKDSALDYYYANQGKGLEALPIEAMCDSIKANFEGKEHKTNLLQEWNAISLQSIINANSGKNVSECFGLLIQKLRLLQHGLDKELQTDRFTYIKLITACEDISACAFACKKPADSLSGLINDLRSSIASHDRRITKQPADEALFTDRTYRGQNRYGHRSRDQHSQLRVNSRPSFNTNVRVDKARDTERRKQCFVCKKEGCWSTRHTSQERRQTVRQYIVE